ncbi:hypothetical protein LCGC14_0458410 [marine sediment metagenome]|uniref:RNA ligase domain-containing protein n=1 Tax=marine sediment metagenome TaxID=412755 RepID=A0A0F9SYI9_9ZZZZ
MRKLATIRQISKLEPIPKADRIEMALIDGWEAVVKKGEFKEGDFCVYFEIDSILPDLEVFEFMRPRKFRVKTARFMGQIAQGLAMPVDIMKLFVNAAVIGEYDNFDEWVEQKGLNFNVTKIIGVIKHDPDRAKAENRRNNRKDHKRNFIIEYMLSFALFRKFYFTFISKKRVRNFPWFIKKTDEERIQNIPRIFKHWDGKQAYVMEKLDGCSATYAIFKDNKWFNKLFKKVFYVCSRNLALHKENQTEWWEMARKYDIKNKLLKVGKNIAIQGEIIGPGIQKNKYKLDEIKLFVFNVIDIDENRKYTLEERLVFCDKYGFEFAFVDVYIDIEEDMNVKFMVEMSKGDSVYQNTDRIKNLQREGIVVRLLEDDRHSFKVVNPEFLLKHDE